MADRITRVTLTANVAGYLAGMEAASAKTRELGTASEKLNAQKEAFTKTGEVVAGLGALAAVGVGAAVVEFAKFSAQMAQVQTLAHATASQMSDLSKAALTMGQGIGYSATQVADAETELVKAGVSVKDIMGGGLKGALDLAAAGQIDVADATSIAASALTEFKLNGSDVPHVADLLAAGADKALGGVTQLGQALSQSGLVAHQFGLTIDDTVGTLAEFAQNGLLGSDAGTSLKQMFLQLASPSKQAKAAMDAVGFSAYDASGKFIGITKLAGELHDKFSGMSDAARNSALSIIFGSDAIRAATVLYKDGAKGNQNWINSVDDTGFAALQAAGKMNSLEGDLKKLGASFQTDLIKSGSAANDVLRAATQGATGLANFLGSLPAPVQGVTLGITALAGAVGLAGGAFLVLVPKVAAAKDAIGDLGITAKGSAKSIGVGSAILVGVTALASGLSNIGHVSALTSDQLSSLNAAAKLSNVSALNKLFTSSGSLSDIFANVGDTKGVKDALDDLTSSYGKFRLQVAQNTDGTDFHLTHLAQTTERFQAQFTQLGAALADTSKTDFGAASDQFNVLVKAAGGGTGAVSKLLQVMPDYKAELISLASAQGKTVDGQSLLNLAQGKGALAAEIERAATVKQEADLAKLSGTATTAKGSITDLEDAIKGFGKAQFDIDSATRAVYEGIDTFTQSLKDNGKTLDVTTQKGRDNQSALEAIASSYLDLSSATLAQTGDTKKASDALATGRAEFIKQAEAAGQSATQATNYANALGLIPSNVTTAVGATGVQTTQDALDKTKAKVAAIPKTAYTNLIAQKDAAVKNIDALNARLKTIPQDKRTELEAEIASAQHNIDVLNAKIISVPVAKTTTLHVDTSAATSAANALKSLIAGISNQAPAVGVSSAAALAKTKKASGGAIRGPGTSTSDSIPAMLSDGEYVVKASSVSKMGLSFMDALNAGQVQKFANGGAVNAAQAALNADQADLVQAQRAYQDANKAHKDAARARVRQLQDEIAADKRALAAAKAAPSGPTLSEKLSFRSANRAGTYDGSSAISDLYSMGQSDEYTAKQRASFINLASVQETALLKLQKQSTAAATAVDTATTKLGDLKQSSSDLAASITSSLTAGGVSNFGSASAFARGESKASSQLTQLAAVLARLKAAGLAPALIAQIASMDPASALKMALSFDKLSSSQISSVNTDYANVQSTAASIGSQVADANYGSQIQVAQAQLDAANANANKITAAINNLSTSLTKTVGKALHLPGYAVGGFISGPGSTTSDSINARLSNGEFVVNARATAANRSVLEGMNRFAGGGYVRSAWSSAAPVIDYGKLAAAIGRGGDTYQLTTNDPVAAAMAIARRRNARSI